MVLKCPPLKFFRVISHLKLTILMIHISSKIIIVGTVCQKQNNLQTFEHLRSPGCLPRNGLLALVMGWLEIYYCLL